MKERIQDIINVSKGTKGYPTIIGRDAQERMGRNGWYVKHPQRLLKQPIDKYESEESTEEFIGRLINTGYKQIKLYYVTTYVRGAYKSIAMVKR